MPMFGPEISPLGYGEAAFLSLKSATIASIAALRRRDVLWTMVSLDDGTEIQGQYMATNLREDVSGSWGIQGTIGLEQPILQFLGGEQDVVTFDVKVWANHEGVLGLGGRLNDARRAKGEGFFTPELGRHDIGGFAEQIRLLPKKDPDLHRPHVWRLTIGGQFTRRVVVKSVGGIRYDRMRASDGSLRGVLFTMELLAYTPYDLQTIALGRPAESLVVVVKDGETYEQIAGRLLGDALLGEALRRRNPDKPVLAAGDLLHVPPASILRAELYPITPSSIQLGAGDDQAVALADAWMARSNSRPSIVIIEDY